VSTISKHFVTFLSPGTFVFEQTTQEIESWNVREAFERSRSVVERYDARPFAFYFTTRRRGEGDLDSKEVARSGRYYLGGTVETLDEVVARNDPKDEILRSNMRANGIERVITTSTPWRSTNPLQAGDVVLDDAGAVVERA
jgi:hypothetical protein